VRRRYREPVVIAFALALIASLSVHLPVYEVLGGLADRFRAEAEEENKARQYDPVEVDFEVPDDSKSARARKKARQQERVKRERQAKAVQAQALAQQRPERPQQPPIEAPQAVQQHSTNPDVEPPDDAQFVAEQNNRVEEETVARVRNMIRDDQLPAPSRQEKPSDTLEEQGNAREQEIAEARNKEGSDARKVTEEEASRKRPDKAIDADPIKAERVSRQAPDGKQSDTSGDRAGETADQNIMITDAAGTFSIRRPSSAGEGGGARAKGRGPGGKMAWSEYEAAVGSDKLEEDRRAYLAERKSTQRGIAREKTLKEFRLHRRRPPPDPPGVCGQVLAEPSDRRKPLSRPNADDQARDRAQPRRFSASHRGGPVEWSVALRLWRVQLGAPRAAVRPGAFVDSQRGRARVFPLGLLSKPAPVRHVQRRTLHSS